MTDWIDTPELLQTRLQQWRTQRSVALDTEFIRERTYYPQLALVQLATRDHVLLIDPVVPGMADALRPLLLDPAVVKVMHSASEDLQALLRGAGAVPGPLFDTQVAAAMCGMGAGLSYQKLVEQVTGAQLEKGETRSDWLRRPLSESQLKYAADDVLHLHEIHDFLQARLQQLGRAHWLRQDNERAVANARNDVDDPLPHLSLRSAERLDADAQARLCRLLRWRDNQARRWDRPKSWVLVNELAVALSRRVPADYNEFSGMLDRHPKAPRKARPELWAIVSEPLSAGDREIPLIRPSETIDKQKLRALQDAVARLAAELQIPDGLLCARKHLEALIDGRGWPGALEGWRRELLEPALAPLLSPDRP